MLWNEEARTELSRMWGEGITGSQIGNELGCSKSAVIGKARRLGLERRGPSGSGTAWTEDEIETLKELRAQGLTGRQIGARIGRSKSSIDTKASKLGLEPVIRIPRPKLRKNIKPGLKRPAVAVRAPRRFSPISDTKLCQYIEGKPTISDDCKCLKPALSQASYCPEHYDLCHLGMPKSKPRFER